MSLSPSTSPRRRLARAGLGLTLSLGLLTGCAQEEPLDDATPSTAAAPTTPEQTESETSTTDTAATTDAAATTDTAPTTEEPSSTADDSAASSAAPTTLDAKGGAFTVTTPAGWEDAIDLVDVDSVQLAIKAPEQTDGFYTNILVTEDEYVSNLTSAVEEAAKELAGDDSEYEILEAAPVDGNKAPGYRIVREVQGKSLVQTQRWISHDGTLYVVTLSALEEQAEEAAPVLDELLESWSWND